MKALLLSAWLLAQSSGGPIQAPLDWPPPPEALLQTLPLPVLLPRELPGAFVLSDVRLQTQLHARGGEQLAVALVYSAGSRPGPQVPFAQPLPARSFMLQLQLPGYTPAVPGPCGERPARRSEGLLLPQQGLWVDARATLPRELLLYSPACLPAGEAMSPEGLRPAEIEQVWRSLAWRQPLGWSPP